MRLPAFPLLVLLALTGCTQVHFPFMAGRDPYAPNGGGETMRRVNGQPPAVPPLATASGNVWPKPIKAVPTLETLEQQQLSLPNQPAPPAIPGNNGATPAARLPGIPALPQVAPTPPFNTPGGAGFPTTGTNAYRTIHLPNGTSAIVVPNGNGTSTIIRADGSVETVPTPK
ncbi:MAG: hypothetical protein ACP5NP_10690 [Acetobacteraceae bacterium]